MATALKGYTVTPSSRLPDCLDEVLRERNFPPAGSTWDNELKAEYSGLTASLEVLAGVTVPVHPEEGD